MFTEEEEHLGIYEDMGASGSTGVSPGASPVSRSLSLHIGQTTDAADSCGYKSDSHYGDDFEADDGEEEGEGGAAASPAAAATAAAAKGAFSASPRSEGSPKASPSPTLQRKLPQQATSPNRSPQAKFSPKASKPPSAANSPNKENVANVSKTTSLTHGSSSSASSNTAADADADADRNMQLKALKKQALQKLRVSVERTQACDSDSPSAAAAAVAVSAATAASRQDATEGRSPMYKQSSGKPVSSNMQLSPSELELFGVKDGDVVGAIAVPVPAASSSAPAKNTIKGSGYGNNHAAAARAKGSSTAAQASNKGKHMVPALALPRHGAGPPAAGSGANKGKVAQKKKPLDPVLAAIDAQNAPHLGPETSTPVNTRRSRDHPEQLSPRRLEREVPSGPEIESESARSDFPNSSRAIDDDNHDGYSSGGGEGGGGGVEGDEADSFGDEQDGAEGCADSSDTPTAAGSPRGRDREAKPPRGSHLDAPVPYKASKQRNQNQSRHPEPSGIDHNEVPIQARVTADHFSRRGVPHKPVTHSVVGPAGQRLHGTSFVSKDDVRSHGIDTGRRSVDEPQASARSNSSAPGWSKHMNKVVRSSLQGEGAKHVPKGKKYHYYEPPVIDDSLPRQAHDAISNMNDNAGFGFSNKPAFAVNAQAPQVGGLFSTYETEAIRQSRKETYLIANMEKKLQALAERERVREELETRSRAEQQRLAEVDRRRAMMIMRRQQDAYIQQQQLLLMQQQQALAAQQRDYVQSQYANAQAHRRGKGYRQYRESDADAEYGSPTTDEGGYGGSEEEGSPSSHHNANGHALGRAQHYLQHHQQHPSEHRTQQAHANAQHQEYNRLQREETDRQKEAIRQAEAAAIIREKIKQREESNARYVQEKAAVDAASNHRELLNFKKKHVLHHESGSGISEVDSLRQHAPPAVQRQSQVQYPGREAGVLQGHGNSPKKPTLAKPSKAGGRAGAAIARGRGGGGAKKGSGHAKSNHSGNLQSSQTGSNNYDYGFPSPRGNQYNHDGVVLDLGQGESSVAIGINEDGSVVISNHSKDDSFLHPQYSHEGIKANSKVLPDVSEYREEKGYEGVSEYNSLIDYALPTNISNSVGELGPMDEAPDDVLNAPPGGFRKHDAKNAAPSSQGSYGIPLLGMVGNLEEEGSSVQITDWNLDGEDYD